MASGEESEVATRYRLSMGWHGRMDSWNERPTVENIGKHDKATELYHHVHLPATKEGVVVEVHFRPSSGNRCPWTNRRLQEWLEEEIRTVIRVEEG